MELAGALEAERRSRVRFLEAAVLLEFIKEALVEARGDESSERAVKGRAQTQALHSFGKLLTVVSAISQLELPLPVDAPADSGQTVTVLGVERAFLEQLHMRTALQGKDLDAGCAIITKSVCALLKATSESALSFLEDSSLPGTFQSASSWPKHEDLELRLLEAKCDITALKLTVVKNQYRVDTYTKETVPALRRIRTLLNERLQRARDAHEGASQRLSQFEGIGSEFRALVDEYTQLQESLEHQEFALESLCSS
eukprot:tig00001107_g7094.t1